MAKTPIAMGICPKTREKKRRAKPVKEKDRYDRWYYPSARGKKKLTEADILEFMKKYRGAEGRAKKT